MQDEVPQPPADELAALAELHAARKVYMAQTNLEARKVLPLSDTACLLLIIRAVRQHDACPCWRSVSALPQRQLSRVTVLVQCPHTACHGMASLNF